MDIQLSYDDFQFINNQIKVAKGILCNEKEGKYSLTGQEIAFKGLIDLLGDRIADEGIGHDGNLNAVGFKLERIIDIFSS